MGLKNFRAVGARPAAANHAENLKTLHSLYVAASEAKNPAHIDHFLRQAKELESRMSGGGGDQPRDDHGRFAGK
jgi:hypothetical protein